MARKYDHDFLRRIIENKGYIILGDIVNASTKVLCQTVEGYKVLVTPEGILRRGDEPDIFSKYNPYTIENIKLWMKINGLTTKLLSTKYVKNSVKMQFECECGSIFETTWYEFRHGKHYCNFCGKSKRFDGLVDYNKAVAEECERREYDLLPGQDIRRGDTRFQYICRRHREYGIQESYPNNFITSYGTGGCYLCGIEKRAKTHEKPDEYYRERVEECGMIFLWYI